MESYSKKYCHAPAALQELYFSAIFLIRVIPGLPATYINYLKIDVIPLQYITSETLFYILKLCASLHHETAKSKTQSLEIAIVKNLKNIYHKNIFGKFIR